MSEPKTILVHLKDGTSFTIFKKPSIEFNEKLREPVLTSEYGEQYFFVRLADVSFVNEPLNTEPQKP